MVLIMNLIVAKKKTPSDVYLKYIESFADQRVKGEGNTLFWLDNWTGCGSLHSQFPRIFILEKKKSCFIAERISVNGFVGAWKKKPSTFDELQEVRDIHSYASSICLGDGLDCWSSKLSTDGSFIISDLRYIIDAKLTTPLPNPTFWVSLVPIKVIFCVWRACIDRLPTATALAKRRVPISNNSCQFCNSGVDNTDHFSVAKLAFGERSYQIRGGLGQLSQKTKDSHYHPLWLRLGRLEG
ncbi:hypothetical protein LXL04_017182 [Taraxacum kok-saghyz]